MRMAQFCLCSIDYNKTAFAPPRCKIIAHEKPGKRRTWAPHGQHGYSFGPAMHHYRCQNVYISAMASERIMDTLELTPHNYQMPQLSSTDRLLMAAKDMTDALQNPHPEVSFVHVGDDTISAFADLAAIFKLKLQQTPSPTLQTVPPTVFQHPCLAESSNQILNSPMSISRRTRSHTIIYTQDITNAPLPPRVVTPRTLRPSPPRVPTHSRRLSPRNLSQEDFCGMDTAHMTIALGENHWYRQHQANAVIHPVTGKEMEYMALMKDPRLQPLWTRGFGNECVRLFQGIRDIPGTDTFFPHQTHQHPERQKYHLQQNSLRLQTSQKRKVTFSANCRRRQTQLLRQRRHFHSRYHNIQNTNQQHPLHQGRRHDDDGH
jgi:hypothetical protein